jgi:hypothetical protein
MSALIDRVPPRRFPGRYINVKRGPHSNESPPLSVSVSGKRDFAGQRQRRRKGPSHSTDRQQRQRPRTKTHQFGAICRTPGNLCLYGTAWWGWEDSNFQPNDYRPLALSSLWRLHEGRYRQGPRQVCVRLCAGRPSISYCSGLFPTSREISVSA